MTTASLERRRERRDGRHSEQDDERYGPVLAPAASITASITAGIAGGSGDGIEAGITAGIEARGLVKSFTTSHGTVEAVRGVDLAVPAGQTVALLGPNGAGKSTTIDMLLGLSRPDAGAVTLFGASPAVA